MSMSPDPLHIAFMTSIKAIILMNEEHCSLVISSRRWSSMTSSSIHQVHEWIILTRTRKIARLFQRREVKSFSSESAKSIVRDQSIWRILHNRLMDELISVTGTFSRRRGTVIEAYKYPRSTVQTVGNTLAEQRIDKCLARFPSKIKLTIEAWYSNSVDADTFKVRPSYIYSSTYQWASRAGTSCSRTRARSRVQLSSRRIHNKDSSTLISDLLLRNETIRWIKEEQNGNNLGSETYVLDRLRLHELWRRILWRVLDEDQIIPSLRSYKLRTQIRLETLAWRRAIFPFSTHPPNDLHNIHDDDHHIIPDTLSISTQHLRFEDTNRCRYRPLANPTSRVSRSLPSLMISNSSKGRKKEDVRTISGQLNRKFDIHMIIISFHVFFRILIRFRDLSNISIIKSLSQQNLKLWWSIYIL